MRFVVANPHVHIHYGKMVARVLTRQRTQLKYSYLLEYCNDSDRPVAFLVDGTRSSFNELGIRFRILPRFFSYLELIAWMLINRINPFHHRVFFNVRKLDPKRDILFNFSFTTIDTFPRNNDHFQFHEYDGLVLTHLTHYFKDPSTIVRYLKRIGHSFLVAENNLALNSYFHHYFSDIDSVYQLPFSYAERFKNIREFSKRQNKCFAIGTFSTPRAKDFVAFFGEGTNLQPMRKEIYQRQTELKPFLDCFMYDYDPMRSLDKPRADDSWGIRLAKRYLPFFLLYKILPSYQSRYLNFDIVEKYNSYKIFVCPEEIVGLPSVSVFEGMACGCAFFGTDDSMYTSLGMEDGVNYIAYKKDSTDDLIDKIGYYQQHPDELERIARRGEEFVSQFKSEKIAERFWRDMEQLLASFIKGDPHFICSFCK